MNTSQLVTYIQRFPANNNRTRSQILEIINDVQNELLSDNSNFNRIQPDPYLATTDGVYEYSLPVNVRAVTDLYSRNVAPQNYGYDNVNGIGKGYIQSIQDDLGDSIYLIPVSIAQSTEPGVACTITFNENMNPKTTTTLYQMKQYAWCEQLETEQNLLTLPLAYRTKVLLSGVMARLVREEYGNGGDWENTYEKDQEAWSKYSQSNQVIGKSSTQFWSV